MWKFILNKYSYYKQKKSHWSFPFFMWAWGGFFGMFINPSIGVIFFALGIYFALINFIPWGKIPWGKRKFYRDYFIPAALTLLIVMPLWNKLIYFCDHDNPYKQPLLTGKALIEMVVDSNDTDIGTKHPNSWCLRGRISLIKEQESFLTMDIRQLPGVQIKRIENNQLHYSGEFELSPENETTNKPINYLNKTDKAILYIPDNIPEDAYVISGKIIITLNSSVHIEIPMPSQKINDNAITIPNIQKYFK